MYEVVKYINDYLYLCLFNQELWLKIGVKLEGHLFLLYFLTCLIVGVHKVCKFVQPNIIIGYKNV
jgi:hypothetical protein